MTDKFDAETTDLVEKISAREITGQSDVSVLKKALLLTVAAYRDYSHYRNVLEGLVESFDESVEYYDPTTWFSLRGEDGQEDELVSKCSSSLNIACTRFIDLAGQAGDNCAAVLKAVLAAPPDSQKAVLGRAYSSIEEDILDAKIEELFEALTEVEYYQSIPENLDAFLRLMEDQWAENI